MILCYFEAAGILLSALGLFLGLSYLVGRKAYGKSADIADCLSLGSVLVLVGVILAGVMTVATIVIARGLCR